MATARVRQFERQLKKVVPPPLAQIGFSATSSRRFHRPVEREGASSVQIVEFQVGERSMEGPFTANLAVFNPAILPSGWPAPEYPPAEYNCLPRLRVRLGRLRSRPGFVARLLFGARAEPPDHWWRLSPEENVMRQTMEDALEDLLRYGLPWLEAHTDLARQREAVAALNMH